MRINLNPASAPPVKVPKPKPIKPPKLSRVSARLSRSAALGKPPLSVSMFGDTKETPLAPLKKLTRAGGTFS